MASDNFIDYVKLFLRSGAGGKGSAHFFRAKGLPNGGPDGGDGGRGGHIILRPNPQLWTLLHLKYTKHIHAQDGQGGRQSLQAGPSGEDRIVEVPLGVVIKDAETGRVIAEVDKPGQDVVLIHGGRGGLGNNNFKTSTNQAPTYAQPGETGQEGWYVFELKLLADVGLVGFPNAGKSTLLSVVSEAKPKIADYPFTTLTPNLGVVRYREYQSFVIADIPGIIEGASEGKGIGLRFLRHIERNPVLLFLIAATEESYRESYSVLLAELEAHNPHLLDKPRVVAISKADLLDDDARKRAEKVKFDAPKVIFSSATGEGLQALKDLLWQNLRTLGHGQDKSADQPDKTIWEDKE